MKTIFIIFAAGAAFPASPMVAQDLSLQVKFEEPKHVRPAGGATTVSRKIFNSEAATRVESYFRAFTSERFGLPAAYFAKLEARDVPYGWRRRISADAFILERERPYLTPAPPELAKELPEVGPGIRFYVAGSNVVALDGSYKVVDAIQVPTIKICEDY